MQTITIKYDNHGFAGPELDRYLFDELSTNSKSGASLLPSISRLITITGVKRLQFNATLIVGIEAIGLT